MGWRRTTRWRGPSGRGRPSPVAVRRRSSWAVVLPVVVEARPATRATWGARANGIPKSTSNVNGERAEATPHKLSTGGSDDFCATLQWARVTHRLACRPACRGTSLSPPSSRRVGGGSRPRAETTCPSQASLLVACQGCARGTRLPSSSRREPVVDCSPVDPTRRPTASRGRACASRACTEASDYSQLSGERARRVWVERDWIAE